MAEALDAAEHRHRRPGRRLAAGDRLGRGQRDRAAERLAAAVAIIFFWTPPHFWALSLFTSDDYAARRRADAAGGQGRGRDAPQILVYSLILVALALAPAVTGLGGPIYLAVAAARRRGLPGPGRAAGRQPRRRRGGRREGLYEVKRPKEARDLFAFSILYLFLLFAALLVERSSALRRCGR